MGSKVNTIRLGSSEFTMSIQEAYKIATSGYMYEKKAVGIVDDKDRLQKEKIQTWSKQSAQKKVDQKPMYDTKPVTRQAFQKLESTFKAMINSPAATMKLTQEKGSKNVEFIPLIAASSNAASNQTVKKPINKKKNNKQEQIDDIYHIDENKEAELLLYWEFQKQLND